MYRTRIVAEAIEQGFSVDEDLIEGCECGSCMLDVYVQTSICKLIGPSYEAQTIELEAVRNSLLAIAAYYEMLIKHRTEKEKRVVH